MENNLTYPIFQELSSQDLTLDNIFLDPNNPRFVSMDWEDIPDEKINDPLVQNDAKDKLIKDFAINKLLMNMEINGYLPIDRVIVKEFDSGQYVVLEGNRRICAAKSLKEKYDDNNKLVDPEIISSIETIPCLVYSGTDSEASWIFQGLRHILGIQEWSAFNKAKLLVNLMDEESLSLTEVGKRFGLTGYGAGQWSRGYYAFKQAKDESDFTREIDEKIFPYFQEIFSRSNAPLRAWLEWNETESKFENELNFNELLSWLYPKDLDNIDESLDITDIQGEWSNRYIKTSRDLRTISSLLRNYNKEFEHFRGTLRLEEAYSISLQKKFEDEAKKKSNPIIEVYESIEECTKTLENLPFRMLQDVNEKAKLAKALAKLNKIVDELIKI
jgi:hypothetical protein